ncbi:MAG: ribbon-helix-helix protein, CopG family [Acidilobus sp.]
MAGQGRRGRPKVFRDPRHVHLVIDGRDLELLELLAAQLGVSRAEVVRRAIRALAGAAGATGTVAALAVAGGQDDPAPPAGAAGAAGATGTAGADPGQDETIGVSSPVTVSKVMEAARRYLRDEVSKALAASLINGIMEIRGALGKPEARHDVARLRERVRDLIRMYDLLARRTRAQSVLRPLGEELLVMADALKVSLHEDAPSGRGRR